MEYRRQTNCVYYCQYHLVLVSKYRRKIFNDGVQEYMNVVLKELPERYPGIFIEEINHDKDHIHILISIPPKYGVWKVVGIIKANTARHLKEKFEFMKKAYYGNDGIWSEGYFVSTVWMNEEAIRRYIEHQGMEDSAQAKLVF